MEKVALKNKIIAIDSMIMIYLLENHTSYAQVVAEILGGAKKIIMSSLLVAEVLTGFYKTNNEEAAEHFINFISVNASIEVIPFETVTAALFAQLRASYPKLSAPDSMHLATALAAEAELFLTNDHEIQNIDELKIVHIAKIKS